MDASQVVSQKPGTTAILPANLVVKAVEAVALHVVWHFDIFLMESLGFVSLQYLLLC